MFRQAPPTYDLLVGQLKIQPWICGGDTGGGEKNTQDEYPKKLQAKLGSRETAMLVERSPSADCI